MHFCSITIWSRFFGQLWVRLEVTVEVKSLFCLSIGVLQGLSAFLKKKNLPELLNLRREKDPDLKLPAGAVFSRLLPAYGTPSKAVTDAFDVISTPLLKRLGKYRA